ncbi:MAG: DMT family transporter [Candidatus Bathyarchaeota archaeon]|nr:DMT family transporter [Candidatus Bathyarchaeota archaeon]
MMGELAALGAAICWTISAIMYKEALFKTKPVSANIVRLVCTSIILVACLAIIGKFGVLMNLPACAVVLACVSGIIGLGFGDTLYMMSLKLIGVARAVPITCVYPLFNLLWAVFLVEEPITLSVILGAVTIVFGIWLLRQETTAGTAETDKKILVKGVAYALATAVMWSVSITMIDMAITLPETSSLDHALAINTIRVTAIAVSLLVSAPIIDRGFGFLKMQRKTLAALIFGGIVALGLGWFFLTYSFINTLESRAVPISSTTPLFSTLSGIVFLHEKVTARNTVGSIMIVVGIFLIFTV